MVPGQPLVLRQAQDERLGTPSPPAFAGAGSSPLPEGEGILGDALSRRERGLGHWIPAFAGMTGNDGNDG